MYCNQCNQRFFSGNNCPNCGNYGSNYNGTEAAILAVSFVAIISFIWAALPEFLLRLFQIFLVCASIFYPLALGILRSQEILKDKTQLQQYCVGWLAGIISLFIFWGIGKLRMAHDSFFPDFLYSIAIGFRLCASFIIGSLVVGVVIIITILIIRSCLRELNILYQKIKKQPYPKRKRFDDHFSKLFTIIRFLIPLPMRKMESW